MKTENSDWKLKLKTQNSKLKTDVDSERAYVGLGSNLGDRAGNLLLAVRGMMDAGLRVSRLSSVYETEPVDLREQPAFLNMVAELYGEMPSPEQMLARLLRIEYALGRRRDVPRGPRTIDLDLLLYAGEQRATELLTLPHPRLHLRRFVLIPLAEIGPHITHPTLQRTIQQLLADTPDRSKVNKWSQVPSPKSQVSTPKSKVKN